MFDNSRGLLIDAVTPATVCNPKCCRGHAVATCARRWQDHQLGELIAQQKYQETKSTARCRRAARSDGMSRETLLCETRRGRGGGWWDENVWEKDEIGGGGEFSYPRYLFNVLTSHDGERACKRKASILFSHAWCVIKSHRVIGKKRVFPDRSGDRHALYDIISFEKLSLVPSRLRLLRRVFIIQRCKREVCSRSGRRSILSLRFDSILFSLRDSFFSFFFFLLLNWTRTFGVERVKRKRINRGRNKDNGEMIGVLPSTLKTKAKFILGSVLTWHS